MWSFLWRPGWILTHLLVVVMVVTMITLGFWQLSRLDERRQHNATVEARQDEPLATPDQVLPAGLGATEDQVEAVEFRQVTATGTYQPADQVLIRNRTYGGVPGYWVITPLVLDDGTALAVNRGWVPFATTDADGAGWDAFAPPAGEVAVQGLVRASQVRGEGLVAGPEDAAEGRLATLSRVDIARLDEQVAASLLPLYLDLVAQDPAQPDDVPTPVPAPDLDEGPHLGYAGQWFIFAALTLIVYPLLLRRVARGRARAMAAATAREGEGEGDPGSPHPTGASQPSPVG
jgi:surfeit locus 1 family protein